MVLILVLHIHAPISCSTYKKFYDTALNRKYVAAPVLPWTVHDWHHLLDHKLSSAHWVNAFQEGENLVNSMLFKSFSLPLFMQFVPNCTQIHAAVHPKFMLVKLKKDSSTLELVKHMCSFSLEYI